MIGIRYGEHYEMADLVGRTVAEAREQYKLELDIPDGAEAYLNGKRVKQVQESKMILSDNDTLLFEVKSRKKGPVLILAAFLLALAVTGGLFAYTWTTATATISVNMVQSDFANVTANATYSPPDAFGKFTGIWPTGTLYDIVPASGYTGDLVIKVYLANAGNLIRYYHHLNMLLDFKDSLGATVHEQVISQLLTLQNAEVEFYWYSGNGTAPYYVEVTGGGFRLHQWKTLGGGSVTPIVYCEVTQR